MGIASQDSRELRALAQSLRANADWLAAGGVPTEHTWTHLRWIADRMDHIPTTPEDT